IIDLEDAHRLQIVSLDTIKDLFLPFFENEKEEWNTLDYIERKLDNINDANQKVQYIRAKWIGHMTSKLSQVFLEKEQELLAGNLEVDLMKCLPERERQLIDAINKYSVANVYNYKSVVEIEIAGYNVIGGLLKEFIHAVLHPKHTKSEKIIKLVSSQFPITQDPKGLYNNVQSVVDYISGMTDLYAIDMYRKITGITIPEIR
ncbi:MAG: dehydrogenase, partial [Flavipsychrobacter sp.]